MPVTISRHAQTKVKMKNITRLVSQKAENQETIQFQEGTNTERT